MNVEHEEVLLIPRQSTCERVTFKYGLGREFIEVLQGDAPLGLDRTAAVARRRRVGVAPRCCGRRTARSGRSRATACMARPVRAPGCRASVTTARRRRCTCTTSSTTPTRCAEYGCQAVGWQTALNPVVALELMARGDWTGAGVLGPESFPPDAAVELLGTYGPPVRIEARDPQTRRPIRPIPG